VLKKNDIAIKWLDEMVKLSITNVIIQKIPIIETIGNKIHQ
jgi:hypothetical protein